MAESAQPNDFGAVKFVLANYEWQYRGEGNAHIAINLPAEKKVIRLPKFRNDDYIDDWDVWKRLSLNMTFVTTIMKPLLGSMFVSPPSLIYFSSDEIKYLNETLSSIRPENRKHKVLSFTGAELYDDHTFPPHEISTFCQLKSLCVELKPKQGVYPNSEKHVRNCVFCCKQWLKLKNDDVSQRSQYCPLDLFSGCPTRMKQAIVTLLHSPQNNLRIFCDGQFVYGEGHSTNDLQQVLTEWLHPVPGSNLVGRFTSLLLQALTIKVNSESEISNECSQKWVNDGPPHFDLKVEVSESQEDTFPHLPQPPCNFDKQDLPEGCILYNLAQAQAFGIMGTTSVHSLLMTSQEYGSVLKDKTALKSAPAYYVKDILKKGCSSELNPIELYLIAAVARDCSILISFQKMKDACPATHQFPQIEDFSSNARYLFKISAVDVDPKPLSCINLHMERNTLIQQACRETTTYSANK